MPPIGIEPTAIEGLDKYIKLKKPGTDKVNYLALADQLDQLPYEVQENLKNIDINDFKRI